MKTTMGDAVQRRIDLIDTLRPASDWIKDAGTRGALVIGGDCFQWLSYVDPATIAAVVTDPPYGIDYRGLKIGRGSLRRPIAGDKTTSAVERALDWCGGNKLPTACFFSAYRPPPERWQSVLVWDKGPGCGHGGWPLRWYRDFELIGVARAKLEPPARRHGAILKHWMAGGDFSGHPNAKPVPLLAHLVEQLTDPGGLVLDPFCGAGSTAVACVLTGRRFLGFEVDPKYAETARRRVTLAAELMCSPDEFQARERSDDVKAVAARRREKAAKAS